MGCLQVVRSGVVDLSDIYKLEQECFSSPWPIEIIYEDSHIFFDFGSEYNPSAKVQPTDLQGLLDEKLVPYVENVFDLAFH